MYLDYFDKFYGMSPYLYIDSKEWEYIKQTFNKDDVKESLAKVAVDFGGRSYFKWSFKCPETTVADIPVSLFEHFFRSFAEHARINLHIKVKGRNAHHGIEAAFKAFARAVKMAVQRNSFATDLPTTKGLL
jgi:imidazoleglycerol phosphate dehydratase HisB